MSNNATLIELLANSKVYRDYARAFSEATGLPLALRPVEPWQLPHHGHLHESPFCALMAESRACAACLQVQQQLADAAVHEPHSITCLAGLCDTSVPVRLGEQLVGFLQTGQVFRQPPTAAQFRRIAGLITKWGLPTNRRELRKAYFNTTVLPSKQYESVVRLLAIFAQHLSLVINQLAVQQRQGEPPVIARARQYIREHRSEDISLGQVARAVNTSASYFCKLFRKNTGIRFTEYLSRVRIEHAEYLLLNPNLRVSEIAYETGFQSLTHFNRVFKKITGRAPTQYRVQLSPAKIMRPGFGRKRQLVSSEWR